MPTNIGGEAMTADPSDSGADNLNADHQRIRKQNGPQHGKSELRTRLGIGRNTARIIVGGAGDQTGAEFLEPGTVDTHRVWPLLFRIMLRGGTLDLA
jgi:hypothetical protein